MIDSTPDLFDQCFDFARTGCTNYKPQQGDINGYCSLRPEETNLQCVLLYGSACGWFFENILPTQAELSSSYRGEYANLFSVCTSCGERLIKGIILCRECQKKQAEERFKRVTALDAAVADTTSGGETIFIFTDGACSGNPGPGGWGTVIRIAERENREMSGGARDTTNNQMELTAAIEALKSLPVGSSVVVTTDSQYMKNGITQWIHNWKRNGWRTADKKPVKNAELWRELDALNYQHEVQWEWVKGHSGHPENERCDELAKMAIEALR